jgi:hypothetical protein
VTLGRDDSDREQPGRGDVVQFGRSPRSRPRWLGSILLACLVGTAAVVVGARVAGPTRVSAQPPVTVRDVGHAILGIRSGYELFGLDHSGVVGVRFARGQVVQTRLPPLQGDGIVSFVAARGEVLVRPLDRVPGYAVPDGKPARLLSGALAHGGILLPGPTSTQQWLAGDYLALVGPGGKAEPAHLGPAVPAEPQQNVVPDGRGDLVLVTTSGLVYDAGPGVLRQVNAMLLAVGSRNWLGVICTGGNCWNAVISVATGASRALPGTAVPTSSWQLETLPGGPWQWQPLPGLTAPDGSAAALIVPGQGADQASLELVSLSSGAAVRVPVQVGNGSSSESMAWSPDSQWLFVITASGQLVAVKPGTGQVIELGLGLSGLSQIVIRSASG